MELSEVEEIARDIQFPKEGVSSLKSTGPVTKSICSIEEIKHSSGKTSMYVINYDEGGFILMSADKRTWPILAFSANNSFTFDEDSYPAGLKFWMNDAKEQMEAIQLSSNKQSREVENAWDHILQSILSEVSSLKSVPVPDCYDHTVIYTVGPLVIPTWHQGDPFNDKLPSINCNGTLFKAYVGCLPLAVAMVMRYHEYPTNYNWSSMPYSSGTITTANFIDDIHDAIHDENSNYPDYDCNGTDVSSSIIDDVFTDQFNYSNAIRADYNINNITSNISYDRPVILIGYDEDYGHAWVCDGFRRYTYYTADCGSTSSYHFHMVWGWGTDYIGWYQSNDFTPDTYNFNSDREMIYNIIP